MKQKIFGLLFFLIVFSCRQVDRNNATAFEEDPEIVQIIMFHLPHRCESCRAVEKVTRALLETDYKSEFTSGKIVFLVYDIQSDTGKRESKRLKASGQTLYVAKGDRISNLTGAAFLYAHTHPERYRKTLRKELEKFLQ